MKALLATLSNGKAPGLDNMEVEILKHCFAIEPDILVEVYNTCLAQSTFPDVWKTASMRIVRKGKDKDLRQIKSYRPICLLPVAGKNSGETD